MTIAIFGEGGFNPLDIRTFDSEANSPAPDPPGTPPLGFPTLSVYRVTHIPSLTTTAPPPHPIMCTSQSTTCGNEPSNDDAEEEAEEDIETVHSIAPGATIHLYEFPESTSYAEDAADFSTFFTWVHRDGEQIASVSDGDCESGLSPYITQIDGELKVLANTNSQGIPSNPPEVSVFVASGDGGALCATQDNDPASVGVNYPASDPNVTSVGGTYLKLTNTNSYGQEQAWDDSDNLASGGGVSTRFTIAPSWQAGSRFKSGVGRAVPDVAADAAATSELAFYLYNPYCGQNHWLGGDAGGPSPTCGLLGGTSMSAPIWAGIAAIYDQYAALNGAPPLGFANLKLYQLERGTPTFPPFHEVNSAQNGGEDLDQRSGYSPTGLGTPDVYDIARDLVRSSALPKR